VTNGESILRTPLADRHEALGARMVEFGGWLMPLQYSGILEEHRAVRARAGLFDLSHMGELYVEGPEAGAALAFALTTDPASLSVGRAHYSMICFPDGGIMDDLIVYRLSEEKFMVVANASNAVAVSDALAQRFSGFDVGLDDRSLATALIAIQGPLAAQILAPLTTVPLDRLRYYSIAEGHVAGTGSRSSWTSQTQCQCGMCSWRPAAPPASCRSGWAPGTPSASRPECPCTETSWAPIRLHSRLASGVWSSWTKPVTSSAKEPLRRPPSTGLAGSSSGWSSEVAGSRATATTSLPATGEWEL
jgi:hypothetical protein